MNIVLVTTRYRRALLDQSIGSMVKNATYWDQHTLTVVEDAAHSKGGDIWRHYGVGSYIINDLYPGASASRNVGAASIPHYKRQDIVTFFDDDMYCLPAWDVAVEEAVAVWGPELAVSGHAHPFNHGEGVYAAGVGESVSSIERAGVLSTVHISTTWEVFDNVGYFTEPGGPGGSEDVDWCKRAVEKGVGLVVTHPHTVIHCGLKEGKLVGFEMVLERNRELCKQYGLREGVDIIWE